MQSREVSLIPYGGARVDLLALTIDLVVPARRKEIESLNIHLIDKGLTRAGKNDHTISVVLVNLMEEIHKLFVSMAIEDQRASIRVENHFQHTF